MGLDNMIYVRGKNYKGSSLLKEAFGNLEDSYCHDGKYEFNYMRKNWGIRNEIIRSIFGGEHDYNDESWDGCYYFKIKDIEKFVYIFSYFLDEKHWIDEADSIWEWHIGIRNLAETIFNLRELEEIIEEENITDEDLELWFVDSY